MSTTRWIGAFEPWASLTMRMMLASAVSLPTLVALNLKLPVLLIVAPMTSSPELFLDRHRLAGDHQLVDGARSFDNFAVHRNLVAWSYNDDIIDHDFLDGQVDLLAVAKDTRCLGLQPDQLLDRFGGAALGLDLQRKAEDDERNDHVRHVPEHFGESGVGENIRDRRPRRRNKETPP